jgi:hypothetical protein
VTSDPKIAREEPVNNDQGWHYIGVLTLSASTPVPTTPRINTLQNRRREHGPKKLQSQYQLRKLG